MPSYFQLGRATLAARQFSRLSAPRSIARASPRNQAQYAQLPGRFPGSATVISALPLAVRLADARYNSSVATAESPEGAGLSRRAAIKAKYPALSNLSPEAQDWVNARPYRLTRWEKVLAQIYGPDFKDKLPVPDRELLDKVYARREHIGNKHQELLDDDVRQQLTQYWDEKQADRSQRVNASFERQLQKQKEADASHVPRPRLAREEGFEEFIPDQAVLVKAQLTMKLLLALQKRDLRGADLTRMAELGFDTRKTTKAQKRESGKIYHDHRREQVEEVQKFLDCLREKFHAIPENDRTPERLEAALREAQQTLGSYTEWMTDENLTEFGARLEKQDASGEAVE